MLLVLGLSAGIAPGAGHAEERTAPQADAAVDAALLEQVRELALHATQQTAAQQAPVPQGSPPGALRAAPGASPNTTPMRFEVVVGTLDPRLKLAPCQRIEPYLPPGVRLWGKARIGLRCTQGARLWNVYLPITVRVFGTALVATLPLPAGASLREADLQLAEIDLAESSGTAITAASLAVGRLLSRPLAAGQGVRQSDLKPRQWFAAGDTVKVQASGSGFSVSGAGQALTPGLEGQTARVRTEGGQVVTGMPIATRVVELSL